MGQIKINNEIFGSNDASDIVYRDTTSVKKAIDDLYKNGGGSQGGGSGSGGSSVEWNQIQTSGTKIAEVTIDGTKKDVFAPTGGSGGGSYSETVLYDYREDNGGVICYDTTTQTLRDDVENYDLLCLEFVSSAGDLTSADWNSTNEIMVNVNLLSNGYNPNYILYSCYDTRTSRHYIKGKEFKTTTRNQASTNGLIRMLGIKF